MKTFEELGVSAEIRQAIEEMGYENPMPVQEEVIPYLLGNRNDVVALAQTGTGKTAAFGLPLIQKIDVTKRIPQALVLCPTRELCLQIAGDLTDYSKYITDLKILPVYGGSSIESQIRSLKQGVHIIVATPGRLIDLMERKVARLETIRDVVMDEADEMLNMGFTDSINAILEQVPEDRNTLISDGGGNEPLPLRLLPRLIALYLRTRRHQPVSLESQPAVPRPHGSLRAGGSTFLRGSARRGAVRILGQDAGKSDGSGGNSGGALPAGVDSFQ